MTTPPPIDRLSGLLERFPVRAQLSFTGTLCGVQSFAPPPGTGYLHVLRRGTLKVTHPPRQGVPARLQLNEASLLFYPRAVTHHFHTHRSKAPISPARSSSSTGVRRTRWCAPCRA